MCDCMTFTNELLPIHRLSKPFFKVMYTHKPLDVIGSSGWLTQQFNNLFLVSRNQANRISHVIHQPQGQESWSYRPNADHCLFRA